MPVRNGVTPGVTANWQPDTNGIARCHCGAPTAVLSLCAAHAQTAVVAAGVTQRHHRTLIAAAQRLLDVIAAADGGGYQADPAMFITDLREAAAHLRDQVSA